jgi:hypothetical protein
MHILIGALLGAAFGAVGAVVAAKLSGRSITWRAVVAGALGGAIGGAVTAATLGAGGGAAVTFTRAATAFVLGGALAGAGSKVADNALERRPLAEGVLANTVGGLVGGLVAALTFGLVPPSWTESFASPLERVVARGAVGLVGGAPAGGAAGAATQMLENAAHGRPLGENVESAATAGFVTGGVVGGTGGALIPVGSPSSNKYAAGAPAESAEIGASEPSPSVGIAGRLAGLEGRDASGEDSVPLGLRGGDDARGWDSVTLSGGKSNERVESMLGDILGKSRRARIGAALHDLTHRESADFDALIAKAGSDAERAYLYKALVADDSIGDLAWLADQIRGRSWPWLDENLSLSGPISRTGAKQQWRTSCQASVAQILRGEIDPVYALKTRLENTDVTAADPNDPTIANRLFAGEQKRMLESPDPEGERGVAVPRSEMVRGRGRIGDDLFNELSESSERRYRGYDVSRATLAARLASLKRYVAAGVETPVCLGREGDSAGHLVICTDVRENAAGTESYFRFYDPWRGKAYWRSASAILRGPIAIARCPDIVAIFFGMKTKT